MVHRIRDKLNLIEQSLEGDNTFLKSLTSAVCLDYIMEIEKRLKEQSNDYTTTNGIYAVETPTEEPTERQGY